MIGQIHNMFIMKLLHVQGRRFLSDIAWRFSLNPLFLRTMKRLTIKKKNSSRTILSIFGDTNKSLNKNIGIFNNSIFRSLTQATRRWNKRKIKHIFLIEYCNKEPIRLRNIKTRNFDFINCDLFRCLKAPAPNLTVVEFGVAKGL